MFRRVASKALMATNGVRAMSTEAPRITIARNMMLLTEIQKAKDVNSIPATSALPEVDVNNLPEELSGFSRYFGLLNLSSSEKFVPDPTAWYVLHLRK